MANELIAQDAMIENVLIQGDLKNLTPAQRVSYYQAVCQSVGLNPLTKPFDYIQLSGRLVLYAKRDATDQLRKKHGVSIIGLERETIEDIYVVTAKAQDRDGRTDTSIGAVTIANLKGDAKANAIMKAETKAKRRVTLSLVGLGWLDETEIETIPDAQTNVVDVETGEISQPKQVKPSQPKPVEPSQPKQAQLPGNGKKVDPMTEFWQTVKAYALTQEQGQGILAQVGGDPVKALAAIEGHSQPEATE